MADYGNSYGNNANTQGGASIAQVSTNGMPFFASDGTMLRVGFKGDTMFISIIPRIEENGRYRWPKEAGHFANLRPHQAKALFKGVCERLLPDIEAKQDHPGHVVVALNRDSTSLCGFSYVGGNAVFSIFQNVNVNRTTNEIYTFVFESTPVIDKYNPLTGDYEVTEVQGALLVVLEALNLFANVKLGEVGHAVRDAAYYDFSRIMGHLQGIANKLGVTPTPFGAYNGTYASRPSNGPTFGGPAALEPGDGDGQNGSTSWTPANQATHDIGHVAAPDVQQVSSLDSLMGG